MADLDTYKVFTTPLILKDAKMKKVNSLILFMRVFGTSIDFSMENKYINAQQRHGGCNYRASVFIAQKNTTSQHNDINLSQGEHKHQQLPEKR